MSQPLKVVPKSLEGEVHHPSQEVVGNARVREYEEL